MSKKEMQYRTFDELIDEVRIDFPMYELEGLIEPQQLIKVAHKVTYELGLRVRQTKEAFIELSHYNARLPDDFYTMNFGFLSYQYTEYETEFLPGLHTESNIVNIPASAATDCPSCYTVCDCNDCCPTESATATGRSQDCTRIIQVTAIKPDCYAVRDYYHTERLSFTKAKYTSPNCDPRYHCRYEAQIKDGHLYLSEIEYGKIFISYQGDMTDLDGNLMVVDHPLANEYYEWACKVAVLQNMYFSNEDVVQKLAYAKSELKEARHKAQSWANMPDFAEMKKAWELNRLAAWSKYIAPFTVERPYYRIDR